MKYTQPIFSCLLMGIFVSFTFLLFSQNKNREIGLPYFVNYDNESYDARYDNWAALQGDNGFMYFANGFGLLEYDGASWRLIKLPQNGFPRSLAKDSRGKIYVGAYADIGFLEADSIGSLQFTSLKNRLPEEERDLGHVWKTYCIGDSVFFHTKEALIRYANDECTIWHPSEPGFFMAHKVDDNIYVEDLKDGIFRVQGDQLLSVKGVAFPSKFYVAMFQHKDKFLVATLRDGLFIQEENEGFVPFQTDVDPYLQEHLIYCINKLNNGWLAIGTRSGGLVLLDGSGQLISILDKTMGLIDNFIAKTDTDDQGGLWLSTGNGLARVEVPSPFTVFDDRLGIGGGVDHLIRFQDTLYAATFFGFKALRKNRFELIPQENFPASYLFPVNDELFVGFNNGAFAYAGGKLRRLNRFISHYFLRSKLNSDIIYVGLGDGLSYLQKVNGEWIDGGRIEGIKDDIRVIVESPSGDLWLESQYKGVWHVIPDTGDLNQPKRVKHFQPDIHIPEGLLFLHDIRNEAVFEIGGIVYKYDKSKDSIIAEPDFGKPFGLNLQIAPKTVDPHGNVWMYSQLDKNEEKKQRTVSILQDDGSYQLKVINDHRVEGVVRKVLYPEEDSIVWYAGADGVVRHDQSIKNKMPVAFKTYVRKVFLGRDSLIFGGNQEGYAAPVFAFSNNSMRFEFAAPSFTRGSENLYQYKLEGFDQDWSDWSSETRTDYTNLPEGKYTFKARSKNIYRQISEAGGFSFEILPPWYRSWWAYAIYLLLATLFIYAIVHWRSRQLKKEKQKLEQLIEEKTSEIQQQAEQLKELDQVKSQFFANISHEFRTPLTLVLGPLENRLPQKEQPKLHELQIMHRNAKRLERLINQLLDLSRIESGKLQLQPQNGDIIAFLKALSSSFSSHAEQRDIEFQLNFPKEGLDCSFDPDKVEKIAYNLLSNAFKFTPDGGLVEVKVKKTEKEIFFEVKDSGQGIPADELPHIFDRFYRSSDARKKEQEGTGIGLALTKELVKLHRGQIHADSQIGRGSTFTVALPVVPAKSTEGKSIPAIPSQTGAIVEGKRGVVNPLPVVAEQEDRPILLVVEDNEDLRAYMANILSPQFRILEAGDGRQGFDLAKSKVPDLIISDLMMPEMDGIELCSQLKTDETTSHIPVILLTARANRESKLEGLSTGADDYLIKPFNAEELKVRVKNLIDQRKLLQQRFSKTVVLKPRDIAINSMDEVFLEKVMAIIEKNMDNADFSVEDFQKAIGMSRMQLHRKLKALTNHSTTEFIRIQRLKRAASLLEQNGGNVSEVCYQVGFNSLSYFTKMFKEQFGVTPSKYGK